MVTTPKPERLEQADEHRFFEGVERAERFFMGDGEVARALLLLAGELDKLDIPYAIIGAMALNEYGYRRMTVDIDVLLTREGLAALKSRVIGRGYVEKFPGSKGMRDTVHGVDIDVVLAGDYPGDGKVKPVAFPDPAEVAVRGERVSLLPLPRFLELKLSSGMTAPHRLKDLADVLELIRVMRLAADVEEQLHPYVRDKYRELWEAAQVDDSE